MKIKIDMEFEWRNSTVFFYLFHCNLTVLGLILWHFHWYFNILLRKYKIIRKFSTPEKLHAHNQLPIAICAIKYKTNHNIYFFYENYFQFSKTFISPWPKFFPLRSCKNNCTRLAANFHNLQYNATCRISFD